MRKSRRKARRRESGSSVSPCLLRVGDFPLALRNRVSTIESIRFQQTATELDSFRLDGSTREISIEEKIDR
jgi:hypothetical protein